MLGHPQQQQALAHQHADRTVSLTAVERAASVLVLPLPRHYRRLHQARVTSASAKASVGHLAACAMAWVPPVTETCGCDGARARCCRRHCQHQSFGVHDYYYPLVALHQHRQVCERCQGGSCSNVAVELPG